MTGRLAWRLLRVCAALSNFPYVYANSAARDASRLPLLRIFLNLSRFTDAIEDLGSTCCLELVGGGRPASGMFAYRAPALRILSLLSWRSYACFDLAPISAVERLLVARNMWLWSFGWYTVARCWNSPYAM